MSVSMADAGMCGDFVSVIGVASMNRSTTC
jgi:hypothetical protein